MTDAGRALALMLVLGLGVLAGPARAVQPDEILPDRALEARARAISAEMRCVVCQNQSIDDSDAPLARDLRLLVRDRLKAGDSDAAVREFVAARYGAFVLLKPPLAPETLLLWFGPGLLALAAAGALVFGRRRSAPARIAALSADETERLASLLKESRG